MFGENALEHAESSKDVFERSNTVHIRSNRALLFVYSHVGRSPLDRREAVQQATDTAQDEVWWRLALLTMVLSLLDWRHGLKSALSLPGLRRYIFRFEGRKNRTLSPHIYPALCSFNEHN